MNRTLAPPETQISRDTTPGKSVLYAESAGAPGVTARRRFFKRAIRRTGRRCVPGCTAYERVSFALEARTLLSTLDVTAVVPPPGELRALESQVAASGQRTRCELWLDKRFAEQRRAKQQRLHPG